jgi:putative ABC transport system permease protein
MWSQVITIALVVACGVGGFLTSFSAYESLSGTRDNYYLDARFADVFATLKRAPRSIQARLDAIIGAAHVETSLAEHVPITIADVSQPIVGKLIGFDAKSKQDLNKLVLRSGRLLHRHSGSQIEALVSENFVRAHQLKLGDSVQALMNGKLEVITIVGIALSPEYIFSGMAGSPDQRGFGVFWIDRDVLAAAYNMQGAFNQLAVRLAPGAIEDAVIAQLDRILRPYGGMTAHGRENQMSHMILNSEIKEQRVLGTILPGIFLAVAGFLLNVVVSRQLATQREQIAALKALGYSNSAIGAHYLKFVMLIVGLGLVIGLALGVLIGHWFVGIYAEVFRFPELAYRLRPTLVLVAGIVTVSAGLLAALNAIGATIRLTPAEAMRPPAPGRYRPMLIEAMGIAHWFSPASRMIIRNMERHLLRTCLTITGIALAMAILITGAFWRDSIALLIDTQFQKVLRGNISMGLIEATPARVLYEARKLPQVVAVEGTRQVSVRLSHLHHHWRGVLQGRSAGAQLHRIVDLNGNIMQAPAHGVLLTDRLAERLHIKFGEMVHVEILEGKRQTLDLPVLGVVSEMMGMNAYIERRALNGILHEADLLNQLTLSVDAGHEAQLLNRLKALPRVLGVFSKASMLSNIQEITARNVLIFSAILTTFATVIAIGVVYNHARIALAERAWEFASLRVLGFTRAEVSSFLLGELLIEIILAIPLGMLLGYGLSTLIVSLIQTDEFYFPVVILPTTYAFAILAVALAGVVSGLIVRRRIDQLDLVAVLKTRE